MPRGPRPLHALALLFAVSGGAGLIHEIAWTRALGQALGQTLQAQAAVLAAFLGGLAIGATAGARTGARVRPPLPLYAALETGIAVFGVLSPSVARLLARLFESLGPGFAFGLPLGGLRLALALVALLPPTILMGATLPVIVRAAAARGEEPGPAVAVLYGANTLGAAAGALAAAFVLLPRAGTRGTFLLAAGLNAAAAGAALVLHRRPVPVGGTRPVIDPIAPAAPAGAPIAAAVAAATGVAGAALQSGWSRAAALGFGSSVYALGSVLAASILGLGAGPIVAARPLRRPDRARSLAVTATAAVGVLSLLTLPLLGDLSLAAARLSARLGSRPLLLIAGDLAAIAALILLPAMAQGASFPALVEMARREGAGDRAAAAVYAASSLGSVGGFLVAGYAALPALGAERTLAAAAGASLLAAGVLLLGGRGRRRVSLAVLVIAGGPCLYALLPRWDPDIVTSGGFLYGPIYRAAGGSAPLREAMRRRGTILYQRDGGDSLVTVRRTAAGVLSLQINGKTEASTGGDMGTELLAGHLPLLLRPGARSALVIGLASGVTLGAVERHPLRAIRVVEIAPAVVEAARRFAEANRGALDDPRLTLILDDARAVLLARRETYDVVASQPSNPWVAGVPNLFTVEFYRLVRRRLRPGGLFCQWVQAYRLDPEALKGIVRSFIEVFPQATLWEESAGGGDYFLLGGEGPIQADPARLSRPETSSVWDDLRRGGIDGPADLLARFVAGPGRLAAFAGDAAPQTDDDLYLEWRAPLTLFRDRPRDQVAALARDPVAAILPTGASLDPGLAAALSRALRRRAERLQILAGLRDADRLALEDPWIAAGLDALRAGREVEAARLLARAAAGAPGSATAALLLGEAYRAAGLEAAALVAYREAIERDPGLAVGWNGFGRCLASAGRPTEARAAFERAVALEPALASAHNNLGAILLRTGDLDRAERELEAALAIDPGSAAAAANLGLARRRRGDTAGAERLYRAALAVDPLNADARFDLAMLLRERGQEEAAREMLRSILRADPGDRDAAGALEAGEAGRGGTPRRTQADKSKGAS
jgi:spermidine synthase